MSPRGRPPPFHSDRILDGSQLTVRLRGELDVATVTRASDAVLHGTEPHRGQRCTLDLRALSFIDCTGLHLLLDLEHRAHTDGWTLLIRTDETGPVTRLITLCHVGQQLNLVPDTSA